MALRLCFILVIASFFSGDVLHSQGARSFADPEETLKNALEGGEYRLSIEDYERAAVLFRRAHRASEGKSVQALVGLAKVNNLIGEYGLALKQCRQALALPDHGPFGVDIYNEMGLAYFRPVQGVWDSGHGKANTRRALDWAENAFWNALVLAGTQAEGVEGVEFNLAGVLVAQSLLDSSWPGRVELVDLLVDLGPRLADGEKKEWVREKLQAQYADSEASPKAEDQASNLDFSRQAIHVGGEVQKPEKISAPPPAYPASERGSGIEGVVIVHAVINREGRIVRPRILKGMSLPFDRAAIDAIRRWKFRPATLDGRPVDVFFNLTMNFRVPYSE